ncbi:MAG: glycosyltransferase [Myxococcota bacterium]
MSLPLRVLYALWHYPHLSESYVRSEIRAVRALGVDVQVWAQDPGTAPYESDVPHFYGDLGKVVAEFRPHLIHTHWLRQPRHMKELRATELPVTVRGHGFDSSRQKAMKAASDPMVAAAFPFPQFVPRLPWRRKKIFGVPVGFDASLYSPGIHKDRRLVARVGVGIPSKDYGSFFEIARRCPDHRFVLAVCPAYTVEHYIDEIVAMNAALGTPAEIRHSLQHEEVAELLREAGTYLHTSRPGEPYGMPISIAEAMASGCYVIGRKLGISPSYIGDAGVTYSSVARAAAQVRATLAWSDADWHAARTRSVNRAFGNFVSTDVLAPIVSRWREIAGAKEGRAGV